MSVSTDLAAQRFKDTFGHVPEFFCRAPGRVNLIGEHTDYNDGFVLPMAIERDTVLAVCRRDDKILHAAAGNLGRATAIDLEARQRNPEEPWSDYLTGVADELAKANYPLTGADVYILGDVPIGAGLSSSASLEMAALCLFEELGGFKLGRAEAPALGRAVENNFLGVNSGIMDQFIVRNGRQGHALYLDCRTLEFIYIPVAFSDAMFVIANTGVTRGLSASKYNERVDECAQAAGMMGRMLGKEGSHLRDFTVDDLKQTRNALLRTVYARALHVITEDVRTQEACYALRKGEAEEMGHLMNHSDHSLRYLYEVTCPELDAMTDIARSLPGCHGSRMTGAGFGGCTVSLVDTDKVDRFASDLLKQYKEATGLDGEVMISSPAAGAEVVR